MGVYEWAWVWAGGRNGGGFFDILTRKMKSRDPGIDVAPPHARYLLPLMEINPQLALEMGNMKGSVRRPPTACPLPSPSCGCGVRGEGVNVGKNGVLMPSYALFSSLYPFSWCHLKI